MTDNRPGETIPIRLFLGGFDLTPTFREVNKKYSTRYYLSLVLIDEGKQLRIVLTHVSSIDSSQTPDDISSNPKSCCSDKHPKA
jgi:vacuolar protein sorting-associated protein 26